MLRADRHRKVANQIVVYSQLQCSHSFHREIGEASTREDRMLPQPDSTITFFLKFNNYQKALLCFLLQVHHYKNCESLKAKITILKDFQKSYKSIKIYRLFNCCFSIFLYQTLTPFAFAASMSDLISWTNPSVFGYCKIMPATSSVKRTLSGFSGTTLMLSGLEKFKCQTINISKRR